MRLRNYFLVQDEKDDDGIDGAGGPIIEAGGDDKNKVDFASHQKLLDEKKSLQAKFQESEAKIKEYELEKLKLSGDKDSIITNYEQTQKELNDKIKELEKGIQSKESKFVAGRALSALKEYAIKEGCIDPEAFIKLNLDRVKEIIVDKTTYEPSLDSVKEIVSGQKERLSYMFNSKALNVNDLNPDKTSNSTFAERYRNALKE